MAEEVNYISVIFKSNKPLVKAEGDEQTVYAEVKVQNKATVQTLDTNAKEDKQNVYDEVKVQNKATEQTLDINGLLTDKRADSGCQHYQQMKYCLGTLCFILLLGIIGFCVYYALSSHDVSMVNQLKQHQRILLAANLNLTNLNNKLSSDYENLTRDHSNLTARFDNLTQAYTVAESKIKSLNDENLNLTMQNNELKMEKKNLTEQIHNMATTPNEVNISRAQWSIDAHCPKHNNTRQCKPCQEGWLHDQSSCYAINNPEGAADQKTWEEAREDCRGKISDLVVVDNDAEKNYVSIKSWSSHGTNGYWIGLRVEEGEWKWVNGSDLTENLWMLQSPTDGHCAISVTDEGWKSVSCENKN